MLIEIWERLRGYDKWTQTEATIRSSDLKEVEVGRSRARRYSDSEPIYEWQSICVLAWTDAFGKSHTAEYTVSENSPLFQLYDGQKTTIRYNPANPEQFYLRGVLGSKLVSAFKWKVVPALGFLLFILFEWVRWIERSR
jgi:hypothetical protein